MAAKIEICWGKKVQERMQQLVHLKSVQLWGRYQGVTIHIEFDDSLEIPRIKRLLIFVRHPQSFFRIGNRSDFAILFRKTLGRKQDLLLQVATKLGGITIPGQLYETNYMPWKGPSKLEFKYLRQIREFEKESSC